MKDQNEELFFVQVKDPNQVRKYILETLREIVEILKSFEKFKQIRHEKLEQINRLRTLLKHTNKVMGNLKLKLPQTNLRAIVVKEQKHPKMHHKKGKKDKNAQDKATKAPPKKELTEVDKLEAELSAIEEKLRGLA